MDLFDDPLTPVSNDSYDNELLLSSRNDDIQSRKKKFIFRLVQALHSAGNLSYRTEEAVRNVSRSLHIYSTCTVFPVSVNISFSSSTSLTPTNSESYTFRISSGFDCSKLHKLNGLCYSLIRREIDLVAAETTLQIIEDAEPLYPSYVTAGAYCSASLFSSLLFFGGGIYDGLCAAVMGAVVYCINQCTSSIVGLSEVESFVSSFCVTCCTCLLNKFVAARSLCLYGQLFGGVVWLLPGFSITLALLEIYSKMIVYGSARLVHGISLACQLGFGIAIGCRLVFPEVDIPTSFAHGCENPLPSVTKAFLLPLASISFAIILNAEIHQLLGMVVVAAVGYATTSLLELTNTAGSFGENAIPLAAAMVVTATARVYAYQMGNQRPLIYIFNGLLILVPGGLGVRGMSNVWSGDIESGIQFTFKMVMIGVCLAIGVFLALLPTKKMSLRQRKNSVYEYTPIHDAL